MQELFLHFIAQQKRYSKHTVDAYTLDLSQFHAFLELRYPGLAPSEISYQQVRSWVVKLMEEKLSPRSVNRKLATLRSYFNWLEAEEKIDHNPMGRLKSLKTAKHLPNYMREEAMETLVELPNFPDNFSGLRDRLLIELLYGTGMRQSELLGLKDSDINFHQATIKVLGKRNKERLIPLHKDLVKAIKLYQEERDEFLAGISPLRLLINDKKQPLTKSFVYAKVKHYLSMVDSPQKRSPHVLRHSFATHLLNRGADINSIKELLGHSSLAATQVYAHTTISQLKQAYDLAHPKSGFSS